MLLTNIVEYENKQVGVSSIEENDCRFDLNHYVKVTNVHVVPFHAIIYTLFAHIRGRQSKVLKGWTGLFCYDGKIP